MLVDAAAGCAEGGLTVPEQKYCVLIDGELVADKMRLQDALLYVKAAFETWYEQAEHGMTISISTLEGGLPL